MPLMHPSSLIDEQIAYYRARAGEYDEWFLRTGRYDRGDAHRRQWGEELDVIRCHLSSQAPLGTVLEIAAGTGLWTHHLAALAERLTAIDSSNETLCLNRQKQGSSTVQFQKADIFQWDPPERFDSIFFGFWLSHVPETHFQPFWEIVRRALKPQGRVFFVDSLKTQRSTALDHQPLDDSGIVERRLNHGETFHIVKRFFDPEALMARLENLGWSGEIHTTPEFFYYGSLRLRDSVECPR